MTQERESALPLPVRINRGLVQKITDFNQAMLSVLPDLEQSELTKIDSHFIELMDRIVEKSGHLPKDFVSVKGRRGRITHVLNGRLLRKDGIWIGLHFSEDLNRDPLEIISINRGSVDQLPNIIGPLRASRRRIQRSLIKIEGHESFPKFRL